MHTLGICFGTSTLQAVVLQHHSTGVAIRATYRIVHDGDPASAFLDLLQSLTSYTIDKIATTGRSFRQNIALTTISEPQAIECALRYHYQGKKIPDAVISSGGETQLVYRLTPYGGIAEVYSGNKCASGSGEFFLQQIRRMGLTIEEAVELAQSGKPSKIAGRCSVFCKSDCTHALNKGEDRRNVVAGLCRMMADKIADLVKDTSCRHVAIVGGGSFNTTLVKMLADRFDTVETPPPAGCFEAFGVALWAADNACVRLPLNPASIITKANHSFSEHAPLADALPLVDFRTGGRCTIKNGDSCILGLDVGSTTTKAVLMRSADRSIAASVYLRTDGDPIAASRKCYLAIKKQCSGVPFTITGLGVTGSGRQLAALHALSDSVVNEIIAHATAAAHFSEDVDTIFEIGGQDAKYTYLISGVPSDYAMNEACSAGTGSFLEEAARESLNIGTEQIGDAALQGMHPANFTDQCAAFIGSDIKRAGQEGVLRNDILAGLVYSICLNYINRVKGARPVGKKIFMQGGVCYNRAVPLAMASIMKCTIIVPPDPGLMGAYGAALEVEKQISSGEIAPQTFLLDELIARDAVRETGFVCNGGKEKCDRKCQIARIRLDGKVYPFGGACNKYYNDRVHHAIDTEALDLVALREHLLFNEFGIPVKSAESASRKTVGIMRSFLSHSLYPLYSQFFDRLGFDIIVADANDREGIAFTESAFCLPVEIAHASIFSLIKKHPDYIFIPHISQLPVKNVPTYSKTCVFVQGEPYYLQTTFRKQLEERGIKVLAPVLCMDTSYDAGSEAMVEMAVSIGINDKEALAAFKFATQQQLAFEERLIQIGTAALEQIAKQPSIPALVLFGRPYNSFTGDINMGIPHKFASRGTMIIPFDMLPAASYEVHHKMFWAMGQKIMKAAHFVKNTPNLFGCFITNFSCGPDSFVLGFFRNVMKEKPSLTLELDQHTADAGIDTRIEAALTIMNTYLRRPAPPDKLPVFKPAKVLFDTAIQVVTAHGRKLPLGHPDVEVVLPSMGVFATESVAAVFRSTGIATKALPVSDKDVLLEGRSCTSCKECLPYILTTGSFMRYIQERKDTWKTTLFFLPTGGGPCRLGQYGVALEQLIERQRIENAAVLTLSDENGYGGFGNRILLRSWQALLVSDVMTDIRSMLSVAAQDREAAMEICGTIWNEAILWFEGKLSVRLSTLLSSIAMRLKSIPLRIQPSEIPVISMVGEIFVRRDEFSRKNIADYLESQGFMVRIAPVAEYLSYSNYVVNSGLGERLFSFKGKMRMQLVARIQEWWEQRIKSILAQSGLYHFEMVEVDKTIDGISHLINKKLRGETILTVGLGMREILNDSCGIISIGPFGCMPSRIAESMLKKELNPEGKAKMAGWEKKALHYNDIGSFPFLAVETDGSPFPQLVEANLEAFVLQARRLHEKMVAIHKSREERRQWKHLPLTLYELMLGKGTNRKRPIKQTA